MRARQARCPKENEDNKMSWRLITRDGDWSFRKKTKEAQAKSLRSLKLYSDWGHHPKRKEKGRGAVLIDSAKPN